MSLIANTVVWASAGTGKTRKLVEVYLEFIEQGVDPLRIVAVTFTEKAAAEMRDRIREALSTKPGSARALAMLAAAPIATIHGFCGMLVREHAFELGLDPSFAILDEQRSLDLAREAARDAIRDEIRSGNEDVEQLFGDFGLDGLVDAVVSAGYWLNSLSGGADWLDARVEAQKQAASDLERRLAAEIQQYGGHFEAIGELADALEAKKARHPLCKRDDPTALLPRIGQIAGAAAAERLTHLVKISTQRFAAKKKIANAMDFDGLLINARDLLKKRPDIRRRYQNHFQALLIDEFQDTDEIQAEIISLLAEDPDDPGRLAPRKLMIVGDPKQSIYRFRRARVTVFFRILDRIVAEGGVVEHLQDNYRSAPPIAHFANLLCQTMMDGRGKSDTAAGEGGDFSYRIRFSEQDMLQPKSDAPFLGIVYVAAEAGARARRGREMEAEAIARLLKDWKASGRFASWKEAAVLMRSTTHLDIYLNALDAHGIPFYVVQGTSFFQKTEVSDLIAFLELVLHPADALLRSIVRTSSLFGRRFDEGDEGSDPSSPLDDIVGYWAERRDSATAAEILQDVIRKTDFDVVLMAQRNGAQRAANVGKLIELTRSLARQGTAALDDVVRHLRDRANDASIRESEAQIVSEDDDVVRVLTVHQSKGLQFDIVILPDLAGRTGRGGGDSIFFSDRWGLLAGAAYGLHRKPLPHALILEEKQLDDDQQYEEEKRLLYVAVTRARKMLVLGEGFSRQGGPWLQWVTGLMETLQPGAIEQAREGKPQTVRFKGGSVKIVPASRLNTPEQLEFDAASIVVGEPYIPKIPPPRIAAALEITPSDLASLDGCFRFFHWTRMLGRTEPGGRQPSESGAARLGSAAHKILESRVPPSPQMLAAAGLTDLAPVFQSPEWRALAAAGPERELPFMMYLNVDGADCWIHGRMDAIAAEGGPPRVIDYKYSRWREGAEAEYEVQMTAYALALMTALDAGLAAAELWYLKPPMKVIRREYARDEAEGALRGLLSAYLNAVRRNDWPSAPRTYCDRVECGFRQRCWGVA